MSTALVSRIETLLPTLDGWCTGQRAFELAACIVALKPKVSVVLGVWGGRDTFAIAMAHQHNGFGKCIAVDPWQAQASVVGQTGAHAAWWSDQQKHDLVYERFMGNMHRLGLTAQIEVHKMKACEVTPPKKIGLLVVDGNHGPDSIADVERWAPNVTVGGVCYADDINWKGGHVVEAVERLKAMGFVQIYERDTGAFFQRVKTA